MLLHLIDKSAVEQAKYVAEAAGFMQRLRDDRQLAVCEIVALEVLYSARSATDYREISNGLATLVWLPVDNAVMRRSLAIQSDLAARGQHRRPIPDLIVAATALEHDATVLHYDQDFDLIAKVTGQPVRWIVPRGTGH